VTIQIVTILADLPQGPRIVPRTMYFWPYRLGESALAWLVAMRRLMSLSRSLQRLGEYPSLARKSALERPSGWEVESR